MQGFRNHIQNILEPAGIRINGSHPWDIQVHDERFYGRVIRQGSVGLGEAYMDGWWDAERLDEFFYRILKMEMYNVNRFKPSAMFLKLRSLITNRQNRRRAFVVGERHYDIGNDLYTVMLDRRLVYSCAYWQNAVSLNEAQEAKLDLVCRKAGLKPGDRVLDIGCGWGSFARFAAEKYGVEVTGITVSKQQAELAKSLCKGLPVNIRLLDYRDLRETFDHIISLGMIEHVGYKNYRNYFRMVRRCLSENGTFVLQTIGSNNSVHTTDPWIHKYIFPNSMIPSAAQLSRAFDNRLVMEDWHNFGTDYDKTLMAWYRNFTNGWDELKSRYSERFYRMWIYYLLVSAASFRARKNQLWQIVFSKEGMSGGYMAPRYQKTDAPKKKSLSKV
jgi:cyclopropane-fatty-acyl-phospholipid synthase